MVRTLTMDKEQGTVLIRDTYHLKTKVKSVSWRGITDAKVTLKSRKEAVLERNGKQVTVRIQAPSGAYFEVESAEQRTHKRRMQVFLY